ncbi:Protein DOWNY MILDEW RESISTANCE 6, partial [Mucuna pruriens]
MDRKLVSGWYNLHSLVPSSYVQPPERRPTNAILASTKLVPVIDLGALDRAHTITNILKSSQDYGFFQVINHGVSKNLVDAKLNIFKEFHAMGEEVKIKESSKDPNGRCKLYTSSGRITKAVAEYWKDTLRHPCHPLEEFIEYWPHKPFGYRFYIGLHNLYVRTCESCEQLRGSVGEITNCFHKNNTLILKGKYTKELRELGLKILELLSEGLGLNPEYFCGGLSENPLLLSHYYPPCPEPSLTLGTSIHKDPKLITILLQEPAVNALQIFKDGEWIGVEPIPNAFVVNIGVMLQIISNGRFVAAEHRVITNSSSARHSVAYFVNPTKESLNRTCKVSPNSNFSSNVQIYDIWRLVGKYFYRRLTICRRIAL